MVQYTNSSTSVEPEWTLMWSSSASSSSLSVGMNSSSSSCSRKIERARIAAARTGRWELGIGTGIEEEGAGRLAFRVVAGMSSNSLKGQHEIHMYSDLSDILPPVF